MSYNYSYTLVDVGLGVTAAVLLPAIVYSILALLRCPKHGDPARVATVWLKIALVLFATALILWIVDNILTRYMDNPPPVVLVAVFAQHVAESSTALALGLMSAGLLAARARSTLDDQPKSESSGLTRLMVTAYTVFGVLFAMVTTMFGLSCRSYVLYTVEYERGQARRLDLVRSKVTAAFDIVMFVTALALVAAAMYALNRVSRTTLRRVALPAFAASCIWAARCTWLLIYAAVWVLNTRAGYAPAAFSVVSPLLSYWPWMVALAVMYHTLSRRTLGLWSHSQPFMEQLGVRP